MTQIPSDDILENFVQIKNTRVWDKLKTVLELYNMEIHQKKTEPDYQQIEDNGEKKYRAESTNQEF